VPAGKYKVTLCFREGWFTQPGMRVFNVLTDGKALWQGLDLVRESGGKSRAVTRTFHGLEPNAQGLLNLWFVPIVNYALVDAIEVSSE
jgi:hypothetical protein